MQLCRVPSEPAVRTCLGQRGVTYVLGRPGEGVLPSPVVASRYVAFFPVISSLCG